MLLENNRSLIIRHLGLMAYPQCHALMKAMVADKKPLRQSEVWLVQHPSILTQGQAGKPEHLLKQKQLQCYQSDRGGQITYHGPGQLVCYYLLHLKQFNLTAHGIVNFATDILIQLLTQYGITAEKSSQNPGVYVNGNKIASVGFRIRHQMSYHGSALNINMDLSGFELINPCGLANQQMTQVSQLCTSLSQGNLINDVADQFVKLLPAMLSCSYILQTRAWPPVDL